MSGPWGSWDLPLSEAPLWIDAEEFPRMADATAEARRWIAETGGDDYGEMPGRPHRQRLGMCDEHEDRESCSGGACLVERDVWRFDVYVRGGR